MWLLKTLAVFIFTSLSTASVYAEEVPKFNMTPGVTAVSRDIYGLHMAIFWICVVIGILVFSVLIYSLIKFRKSKGAVADAKAHDNKVLEIVLAIIPLFILVAMAVPATKVLMNMDDTSDAAVNIKVVGYQWYWRYEYLDEGISFYSRLSTPQDQLNNKNPKDKWYLLEVDHPLVVPVGEKIRFLVTSNDVIHSWWVPALGIKRDAIPGFVHEAWARIDKPGIYRGQCAELCGVNHGFMPVVVEALPKAEYEKWLAGNRPAAVPVVAGKGLGQTKLSANLPPKPMTKAELMKQGEEVYTNTCAVCHKPDGAGMPPVFPALKGSKIANGPAKDHIDIVLQGKPGTAMQAFGNQLSDTDIAAVITYERNSWENKGSVVQPPDVYAARK